MASLRNQARAYWRAARAPRYSLLFALPLLVLYEGLAAMLGTGTTGGGVRNGADVLLKGAFAAVLGAHGPLVFGALLIAGSAWLVARDMRRSATLEARYFAYMLAESVALGLLVGLVVGAATVQLLRPFGVLAWMADGAALALTPVERLGWWTRLMIS
ncbi:MAG TPA: hypothetical protein VFY16_00540, partial [Gemmatimonadaceae bacterium]|nr:hypothetical protein [Gemmatimonadaceae bacterium]